MDEIKITAIKNKLIEGLNKSKQLSYERRAPDPEAVPIIMDVISQLDELLKIEDENYEALELLSLAHEALLNYDEAFDCLSKSIFLSKKKSKKLLKKLAHLKSCSKFWSSCPISPMELRQLGIYLNDYVDLGKHKDTFDHTKDWCKQTSQIYSNLISFFNSIGAYSDFQVLKNVV